MTNIVSISSAAEAVNHVQTVGHAGGVSHHTVTGTIPVNGIWQDPTTGIWQGPYDSYGVPYPGTTYPSTYPGTIGPAIYPGYPGQVGTGGWAPSTLYPGTGIAIPLPETKMNLSIYRDLSKVRQEVAAVDPKVRWTGADYRINSDAIDGIGVDLELQFWKDQFCEGEVILEGDMVWFSSRADAQRFEEEFIPRIQEMSQISDFEKPWPDITEFLNYHRVGQPISFVSVVRVNQNDLFENSYKLNNEGIMLWFMLKAGSIGKVFYFEAESTFAFENAADAILFAAYMTDADKKYGEELDAEPTEEQALDDAASALSPPARKKGIKSKPARRRTSKRQKDMDKFMEQVAQEIARQKEAEDQMGDWAKIFDQQRFGPGPRPTWSDTDVDLEGLDNWEKRQVFYPSSVADVDLKKYVRSIRSSADVLKLHGAARATLSARHSAGEASSLEALAEVK